MKIVEHTPRLSIGQVRACPLWSKFQDTGEAIVVLEVNGRQDAVVVAGLTADETNLGTRWWLSCPLCGSRRRYLHLVDGELMCRPCGGLLYQEQTWPASRWRVDVGRPTLRAWRRLEKAA